MKEKKGGKNEGTLRVTYAQILEAKHQTGLSKHGNLQRQKNRK